MSSHCFTNSVKPGQPVFYKIVSNMQPIAYKAQYRIIFQSHGLLWDWIINASLVFRRNTFWDDTLLTGGRAFGSSSSSFRGRSPPDRPSNPSNLEPRIRNEPDASQELDMTTTSWGFEGSKPRVETRRLFGLGPNLISPHGSRCLWCLRCPPHDRRGNRLLPG